MDDISWRHFINNQYTGPDLPSDGKEAPKMENTNKPGWDGETPVLLQKVITEVYVYTSLSTKEILYSADSIQDVQILGNMRLSEAKKIIDGAKKKRRRR